MADKKISQLDSTTSVNTGAMFPLSQTESGNLKTVKGTVDQIGDYVATVQDHSTLTTTSKKLVGAINEKMDKANPTGTGALSIGRKSGTTTGSQSMAVGYDVEASGARAIALGHATIATGDKGSFAEGYQSKATGAYGSHAEGNNTTASGDNSHAEGNATKAEGNKSHAEGQSTTASGVDSHAEGSGTKATADHAHAEGYQTEANGNVSHAAGFGTVAKHRSQYVFGEYNVPDPSTATISQKGTYVEIVGRGTANAPANARTLDWSGNETLAGGLKLHENQDAATLNASSSIAAGATYDFTNYSDGTVIFVYRPSDASISDYTGIYIRSSTWTRLIPIKEAPNVTTSGYILTNGNSQALRCVVVSV